MALVKCKECSREVSDQAAACVGCGAPIPKNPGPAAYMPPPEARGMGLGAKLAIVAGAIVVAFFGFGAVMSNTPEGQTRIKARDAIAFCWEEQGRKSLDAASQRLAAGACEGMENAYEQKFGRRP